MSVFFILSIGQCSHKAFLTVQIFETEQTTVVHSSKLLDNKCVASKKSIIYLVV